MEKTMIFIWGKDFNRHFTKEYIWMAKYMKRHLILFIIREKQTKAIMRYTPLEWLWNQNNGLWKMMQLFGKQFGSSPKVKHRVTCVFISHCCCNKWPQIQWLETTHMYCLTPLEDRSLKEAVKPRCQQGWFHQKSPGETLFLAFFSSRGAGITSNLLPCSRLAPLTPSSLLWGPLWPHWAQADDPG